MILRPKGFNVETYGLAKNVFLKKMAKCFAALFDNVLENLLKTNTLSVTGKTHPSLSYIYNSISCIQMLQQNACKNSKVLNHQPASS